MTGILDGTRMLYTYPEMGTVRVSYRNGSVGFEWVEGALKGATGEGFAYRARKVGDEQFFVSWHEPDARGFVTLHVDFEAGRVHSSVLAGYGTPDEQIHFHRASIERVERPGQAWVGEGRVNSEWEQSAKNGEAATLDRLLAAGEDPNARDRHNQTALMIAAHAGHLEAVRVLIEHGADLDARAKHNLTATMLAVVAGHEEVAALLADAGADLAVRGSGAPGFAGKTAANLAAERGWTELAARLTPATPSA